VQTPFFGAKTVYLTAITLLVGFANATYALGEETRPQVIADVNFCYTPSRENTAYSELLKTEVDSPNKLIAYGDSPLQFGELWLPYNSTNPPLVIFVHGGCWLNAYDIQHSHALSTGLRRSGYAVWSIEYRRTGDEGGGWPGSLMDVTAAIHYGLNNLNKHVDINNTVVMGHSAGGHLALLASSDKRIVNRIKGVIGLAAIIDPALYSQGTNSCESATADFIGGTALEIPDAYKAATVVASSLPTDSKLLIGSADRIVSKTQSEQINIMVGEVARAGHFDFIDPHSWAFSGILRSLAKMLPVADVTIEKALEATDRKALGK